MARCSDCGRSFSAKGQWQRRCWTCWRGQEDAKLIAEGFEAGLAAASSLDERLLRDAIALCHPDRHPPERFLLANRVTASLIELLQAATRRAA
ncbi:MAG: hypothetical protein M3364_03460 [Actinomycetota bacterium]|nr:hypothetical protein [Actinomycetota bacterium]